MPWIEKTVDCGNVKFVKRYFSTRYGTKGQIFRAATSGNTSEAQERVNDKNKIERFSILANANFKEDDYFLTFTYEREKRPESVEQAKQQWSRFLRRMRKVYRQAGEELRYQWCLEYKKSVYHFHLLCNNAVNSKVFRRNWEYGSVNIKNLDDRKYHTVGEYMMKEQYLDKPEKTKSSRCYGSSKNLYRPEPDIKVLENDGWSDQPEEEVGYTLDDDSLENGVVTVEKLGVDFRYQAYRLVILDNEQLAEEIKKYYPQTRLTARTPRDILLQALELAKKGAHYE